MQTIPPPYVVRTILVYSRPPCQPQFSLTEPMKVRLEGKGGKRGQWLDTKGDLSGSQSGVSAHPPTSHPLQKMFQCPYFFFDIIYIHSGPEEKEDDMSWKVRCHMENGGDILRHLTWVCLSLPLKPVI